jgi:hypothetical protein
LTTPARRLDRQLRRNGARMSTIQAPGGPSRGNRASTKLGALHLSTAAGCQLRVVGTGVVLFTSDGIELQPKRCHHAFCSRQRNPGIN